MFRSPRPNDRRGGDSPSGNRTLDAETSAQNTSAAGYCCAINPIVTTYTAQTTKIPFGMWSNKTLFSAFAIKNHNFCCSSCAAGQRIVTQSNLTESSISHLKQLDEPEAGYEEYVFHHSRLNGNSLS